MLLFLVFVEIDIPNVHHFSTTNFTGRNIFKLVKTTCKIDPKLFSFPNIAVTAWNSSSNNIVSPTTLFFLHQSKRDGPVMSQPEFFAKLYTIWCILVMPDLLYSISFEYQHFQPPLYYSYHFSKFVIISGKYWMKAILWTNSEISTFISSVTILTQLPSTSFACLLRELDLVYVFHNLESTFINLSAARRRTKFEWAIRTLEINPCRFSKTFILTVTRWLWPTETDQIGLGWV